MAAAAHPEVTPACVEHRGSTEGAPSCHMRVTDTASPRLPETRVGENCRGTGQAEPQPPRDPVLGESLWSSPNGCRSAAVTLCGPGSEQDADRGPLGTPGASSWGVFGKGTQREGCGKGGARSLAFCTFWPENARILPPLLSTAP